MFISRISNQLLKLGTKHLQKNRLFFRTSTNCLEEKEENKTGTPDKLFEKVQVVVRGNEPAVLKSYSTFILTAAHHLDIKVENVYVPRKPTHQRLTLLKSKHVHKKHRVQYEMRTYYRFLHFLHMTGSTTDTFLEYIQRMLPEGVAMKVTKTEIQKLPVSITAPTV